MKNKIYNVTALLLVVIITIMSLSACGEKKKTVNKPGKKPASSQNASSADNNSGSDNLSDDISSDTVTPPVFNLDNIVWDDGPKSDSSEETVVFEIKDMFDNDENTYWSPNTTESSSVEFSLDKEVTFNAIKFIEQRSYITDYIIEVKQSGSWVQVYRQDEMGRRTGILDKNFTAKDFRLTVTMSNELGGIYEIQFKLVDKIDTPNFSNVTYYTMSRLARTRANDYNELKGCTDIILFDFGAWNEKGEFTWHDTYNKAFLEDAIAEVKAVLGDEEFSKLRIWFSLQNYDKKAVSDPVYLFTTEESRKKLADFALSMCEEYGFYGVDIDYEYPNWSKIDPDLAWANYDRFLKLAADTLHAKGYKLSAAMSPTSVKLSKETINAMDKINIMAYDVLDGRGNHSSYKFAQTCISYFTDLGFDKSKLVLGLPSYTKTTTNKGGQGIYWIYNRFRGAIKPWVNSAYTNQYTYYFNGPYLLRDKTYLAMSEGLGGIFFWVNGSDVPDVNQHSYISVTKTVDDTIARFKK